MLPGTGGLAVQEAILDAIAETEGVDGVFIGPNDLSADLGYLGNWQHPEVWKVMEDAAKRIRKAGKAPGILYFDEAGAKKWYIVHTQSGYENKVKERILKRAAEAAWMRDKIIATVPSTAEQVHVQQILLYNQDTAVSFFNQLNGGADFNELAFGQTR